MNTDTRKGKTQSVLPNSSPAILRPMANGLQIRWHDADDRHILYQGETRIAAHHNGFSCCCLAERILSGDTERAIEQFEYIRRCGGRQYVKADDIARLVRESEAAHA